MSALGQSDPVLPAIGSSPGHLGITCCIYHCKCLEFGMANVQYAKYTAHVKTQGVNGSQADCRLRNSAMYDSDGGSDCVANLRAE